MCGISGVLVRQGAPISLSNTTKLLENLYRLSESRGKESAGLHVYQPQSGRAWTLKGAQRATDFLNTREYRALTSGPLAEVFANGQTVAQPVALLAHSRLVTNGMAESPENNQPVRWGAVSMIHNGICVNVDSLWKARPQLQRHAEVDTEILAAMAAETMAKAADPVVATRHVFDRMRGAASVAWVHDRFSTVTLATNTGDLYYVDLLGQGLLVFASEHYILENAVRGVVPLSNGVASQISWLAPGHGLVVDLMATAKAHSFDFAGADLSLPVGLMSRGTEHADIRSGPPHSPTILHRNVDESLVRYNEARIRALKRCTRCVLPESFPFIEFDAQGMCNYCRSYRPRYTHMHPTETKRDFIRSIEKYRRSGSELDVLVAFSGGRDSSYGLHLIKKEFGLTPVTFTYDWGMVTDLARRNIARMCGQLGIQNILVSADLAFKRENIRKNVVAWLKKPDLGLVPLFMAGDKHFFHVVNQLKRQTSIQLDLWCANPLENTDFKAGFCGVLPDFDKKRVDDLSLGRKAQLAMYYCKRFLQNPGYLNSSLADTFSAFMAYYFEPRRDFFFIFDHFVWDEREVNRTLLGEYDWELSPDSPSTWRIGDGTAPFYNYIYMTARGFTEFDTFRSNQIREGMMQREEALEAVVRENRPRIQSLRWYLDTINLDFNSVIRRINNLDTVGLHH